MSTHTLCLPLVFATLLAAQDPGTAYRFRVLPGALTHAQIEVLEQRFDFLHHANRDGSHDVVVQPPELAAFKALELPAVLVDRGRPYREIAAEAGPLAPDALYYTPAEVEQAIDQLATAHPTLARKVDLSTLPGASKTVGGRSLLALKISKNVSQDEDEPAMYCIAQHHARELNSTVVIIEAARRILGGYASDPALQALVDGHELYFVPCVNPDGTEYVWTNDNLWRKNRLDNGNGSFGVDNNRNYPYGWSLSCGGSTVTSSETYRGPSAGSEAETKTMRAAIATHGPDLYIDIHSYGREVLFPYGPCVAPPAALTSFLNGYITDLRTAIGYQTRASSASAEAPHDHWATRGTLSLLIEVGTAFQPTYASALTEEAQVWPGLKKALTTWKPAVRGHVRSIEQGKPLAATITYTPQLLTLGEQVRARARDGRYGLWLPIGTHQVTFTAPNHQPYSRPVTVTSLNTPLTLDIELVPSWADAVLTKNGSDRIGTTTTFNYSSPGDAGATYWVALSTGTTPGIDVGLRRIPLNPDGVMVACATPDTLLLNNLGTLPATGGPVVSFPIPPLSFLVGLKLYAGGMTLAPGYPNMLKKFSPAVALTIQP